MRQGRRDRQESPLLAGFFVGEERRGKKNFKTCPLASPKERRISMEVSIIHKVDLSDIVKAAYRPEEKIMVRAVAAKGRVTAVPTEWPAGRKEPLS